MHALAPRRFAICLLALSLMPGCPDKPAPPQASRSATSVAPNVAGGPTSAKAAQHPVHESSAAAFMHAALRGQVDQLAKWVDKDTINTPRDEWGGATALMFVTVAMDSASPDYQKVAAAAMKELRASPDYNPQTDSGLFRSVDWLLQQGADPNKMAKGTTALHHAVGAGEFPERDRIVKGLWEARADVSIARPDGVTPLALAIDHGHGSVLYLLVHMAGADIHKRDKAGFTPILRAIAKDDDSVRRLMPIPGTTAQSIKAAERPPTVPRDFMPEESLSAQDADGNTPLLRALEESHVGEALWLTRLGSPLDVTNRAGKNAEDLASNLGGAALVARFHEAQRWASRHRAALRRWALWWTRKVESERSRRARRLKYTYVEGEKDARRDISVGILRLKPWDQKPTTSGRRPGFLCGTSLGNSPRYDQYLRGYNSVMRAAIARRRRRTGKAPVVYPRLSRSQIAAGMKPVRKRVQRCYRRFGVPGLVSVRVTIAPKGRVVRVKVLGSFAGTPTGACVERAVKKARFPRAAPIEFTYPFSLRDSK